MFVGQLASLSHMESRMGGCTPHDCMKKVTGTQTVKVRGAGVTSGDTLCGTESARR